MKKETIEFLREEVFNNDNYEEEFVGFAVLEELDEDEFSKKDLIAIITYLNEELKGRVGMYYRVALDDVLTNLERESE